MIDFLFWFCLAGFLLFGALRLTAERIAKAIAPKKEGADAIPRTIAAVLVWVFGSIIGALLSFVFLVLTVLLWFAR